MKQIAIVGSGGFGREVALLIKQVNAAIPTWNFVGFYDDNPEAGNMVAEHQVLGNINALNDIEGELYVVIAVGDPKTKKSIISKIDNKNVKYPILIHPNAIVPKEVRIGEGSIITAGNILTVNIDVGSHVILNLSCTVGHDTNIGNFCSFMPSVNISGEVNIGECVYVGTGAKIINQLDIGKNTIVGAGAVVAKNLPENCTAVGIPAKAIKFH